MKTKLKKFLIPAVLLSFLFFQANGANAYESGIHYYLTYVLADVCGLGTDGETIALADYSVDKFHDTDAGSHFDEWIDPMKEITRRIFHFPVSKGLGKRVRGGSTWAWESVNIATREASASNVNPIELGIGIHTLQDSYAHEGFTAFFGHWTQGPDLPKNDVPKLLEAAQSTWTALDGWSTQVTGHGCTTQFSGIEERIKVWASLDLNSDKELLSVWNAIAENVANKAIAIDNAYEAPEFQTAFQAAAAHIRALKR